MFKNCCGCPGKKATRKDSLNEDGDEETTEKEAVKIIPVLEPAPEPTAKDIAQISEKEDGSVPDIVAPRKTSLKKPKPRLSISTEVKIIPSNFLEDYEGEEAEAEPEPKETEDEPEADEDEVEEVKIVVKNIDGKVIKRSEAEGDDVAGKISTERPSSPLSDEVFAAAEQPGLELPLHNLGVRLEVAEQQALACGLDIPLSPRGNLPTPHPAKRCSMPAVLPRWLSEDDDETGGTHEPPATPVARDELALRRHRFFSELLSAAQAANEHRVRFDPFGPTVTKLADLETTAAHHKELEILLDRLEKITERLEKTVPILEQNIGPYCNNILVTKSLEDLLDEHLTPTEKKNIGLLINSSLDSRDSREDGDRIVISPDSSADFEDLSDREERIVNGSSDNSSNSQDTVVREPAASTETKETKPEGKETSAEKETVLTNGYKESSETMTNSQSTLSMSVQGYQDILQGPFASYLQLSAKIGGDVAEHAKLVQKAFQAQQQYLSLASQRSKPASSEDMKLLQPTSQHISSIQEFREKHRTSAFFNHLSAVSESIPALGWVTVAPAPSPFVKEMNDAGQFYTNRVLKDWKEKDKTHIEWTKAWVQTLSELQSFVKKHHTTGLVWSGAGGAPPPPPPGGLPPPPPMLDLSDLALDDGSQDRSALFAEINQGANITKSLKKVTSEMQTHKNPGLRSGPAPFKAPPTTTNQTPKPFSQPAGSDKPAKFSRDGKKWLIEYQKGNHQLVVDGAEMNNVVYVFKCVESTVTVKGKVNSIFLDSCKKTAVVFDSLVSSIEFVNCQSVQMQVLGKVPTISIDKTDGCQMYLSDDSLQVEVISSKSSEMNILVPKGNGDFTEYAVPEQFKTTVSKKGLATIAVESQ